VRIEDRVPDRLIALNNSPPAVMVAVWIIDALPAAGPLLRESHKERA